MSHTGLPGLVIVFGWIRPVPHRSRAAAAPLPPYRDIAQPGDVDPRQLPIANYNRPHGGPVGR
jgi:hypothetical protein